MWLEDLRVGQRWVSPGRTLTAAEIHDFATRYDAQFLHIDAEAAAAGPFGGVIASGFHTLAVAWSLFLQTGALGEGSRGGIGVDEVRWLLPVRPGDTLRVETEILELGTPKGQPRRGRIVMTHTARNQHGQVVLTYRALGLIAARPS
jgi:acyl dehydratase